MARKNELKKWDEEGKTGKLRLKIVNERLWPKKRKRGGKKKDSTIIEFEKDEERARRSSGIL